MDLLTEKEKDEINSYIKIYKDIGYEVVDTYKNDPTLLDRLEPILKGKTTVLAGQSGVGKSTLLNTLIPNLNLKTGEISQSLGRGKHTTRHVELIEVAGGLVADTPGFSSFEFEHLEKEDLTTCFPEFERKKMNANFVGVFI